MSQIKLSPMLETGKSARQPLVGVSGALIFFIVGLCADIILNTYGFIDIFSYDLTGVNFFVLTIIVIGLLNEVIVSFFIIYFIFNKKIIFRLLYVVQTCIYGACSLILLVPLSIIFRIIWIVYLYLSERVKNTYTVCKNTTLQTEATLSDGIS